MWMAGRGRRRPAIGGGGATGGIWSLVGDSMKRTPGGPSLHAATIGATVRLYAAACRFKRISAGLTRWKERPEPAAGGWRLIRGGGGQPRTPSRRRQVAVALAVVSASLS